jgi:hypothetical protein
MDSIGRTWLGEIIDQALTLCLEMRGFQATAGLVDSRVRLPVCPPLSTEVSYPPFLGRGRGAFSVLFGPALLSLLPFALVVYYGCGRWG